MPRWLPGMLLLLVGWAARGEVPSDAGSVAFRLEGKSAIDDVFGDTSDYRRTIDRFLELTTTMQTMRDDFARAVQQVLGEVTARGDAKPHARACPIETVALPYARAQHLGAEYLRVGRELGRHFAEVREYDRLGESIGLTPDYRWKVRRVLAQYNALLTDYREMKVAFHDQLNDELRYLGCDLGALLLRGDPQAKSGQPEEAWPQPGQPGAPGVAVARADLPHEAPPTMLPAERVPPPAPIPLPARPIPPPAERRSGVLFYVDNSHCARGTTVFLDGKRLGEVKGAARVGFQTAAGPHDLCLAADEKKPCGAPGTVRRSYLHEGWTISLRCE
jgi:hypothetical protein